MMRAFGSIRWMKPTCRKLLGSLSMKYGRPVLRWMRVRARYSSPSAQLSGGQSLEHLRVAGAAVGRLCPDAVREHRHVGQLHGALHMRVAREDLLAQRRACQRQSDDEDRGGRRGALTGGARRDLAGVERLRA